MRVEAEAGRAVARVVAPRALEDAAAVVDDVGGDVDLGVRPLHELAVHPDLAGPRESHSRSFAVNSQVIKPSSRLGLSVAFDFEPPRLAD